MKYRSFDLIEPVPELNQPHVLAIINPWLNAGNAGSLVLSCLEGYLKPEKLAKLGQPGHYFDFTRYRPTLVKTESRDEIIVPNVTVDYSRQAGGHDFIMLRLLEPHALSEELINSTVALLKYFKVKRYCLIGSMYEITPHTRRLLVTSSASNLALQNDLAMADVLASNYEGPTSILSLIPRQLFQSGIETCSMVVHLPSYLTMEDDYRGETRLMEVISSLYNFPVPQADVEKANRQEEEVKQIAEQFIKQEPKYKVILEQLESNYDSRVKKEKIVTQLSPEIEKFLQDVSRRYRL